MHTRNLVCVCVCVRACVRAFSRFVFAQPNGCLGSNLYIPLNPIQEEEKYFVVLTYYGREYNSFLLVYTLSF